MENELEPSSRTYLACPECGAPVNATLAIERRVLDVLYAIAPSPAWDKAKAPDLEVLVTRAVEHQDEIVHGLAMQTVRFIEDAGGGR